MDQKAADLERAGDPRVVEALKQLREAEAHAKKAHEVSKTHRYAESVANAKVTLARDLLRAVVTSMDEWEEDRFVTEVRKREIYHEICVLADRGRGIHENHLERLRDKINSYFELREAQRTMDAKAKLPPGEVPTIYEYHNEVDPWVA